MDWIAADWGTTHLRLWEIDADGGVSKRLDSDQGMGVLDPSDYEPTLLGLLRNRLPEGRATRILACGMVGARQGWIEAPYSAVPIAPLAATRAVKAPTRDPRLDVHVLPGLSQAEPADVMRGEEMRIAGVFASEPGFDGVICLPGLHTIWVQVSAGEVVSFRTCMTGELLGMLSERSVLRLSVGSTGWDANAFAEGLDRGLSRPEALSSSLFTLRAESLLRDLGPEASRARLTGLLIGTELASVRPYWLGQDVRVVGEPDMAEAYSRALESQGVAPKILDSEEMTLAGFRAAHEALAAHAH
ncbi:2-keto-3-deoxy-galactonokinase [Roseivivax halodurans JCM 10272]|uniref:2-keto-3-deoxy-galactonokinase n=1 Tax=Roseivivax halodurans JCM 10272 TaxID=1449350 RepID=X7EKQ3_9RHOB|nr:2-dehydro-3-deoxygalactonokinase [Roseivivax halodurans]ETX16482.1 2-keto-3-deoxy-galactonokinase [Roseivivax halodurans JCM 10272]